MVSDFITKKQVARILNVSPSTIVRWVVTGHLISPFNLGPNRTVWSEKEIREWIEKRKGDKVKWKK